MQQPVRVLHWSEATFYGYGANSSDIQTMTSCHPKGKEPFSPIVVFGKSWEPEQYSYGWDGIAYMTWREAQGI